MNRRSTVRATTLATLAAPAVLALAACSGSGHTSASAAATATATPRPTATAAPVGERVAQTCDELLPETTFAVYGRSFTLEPDQAPAAGSPAATIAGQRGRVCVYRATDGTEITVAVAHLPEKALTNLKDTLYERGRSVPTYTVEGYFAMSGDDGRADAFADPYWINAVSSLFTEPGAAQPVVDQVRGVLGTAGASSTPTPSGTATAG